LLKGTRKLENSRRKKKKKKGKGKEKERKKKEEHLSLPPETCERWSYYPRFHARSLTLLCRAVLHFFYP
jgi:hypothetical protein